METERRIRLLQNESKQIIHIPKDFELPGDEAIIGKRNGVLFIKPFKRPSLIALLATLGDVEDEFSDFDEGLLSPDDVDL